MLFRKKIEPSCSYCAHGAPIDGGKVICVKKGIVSLWDKCRRFEYDPLRRDPETPSKPMTAGLKAEDFEI